MRLTRRTFIAAAAAAAVPVVTGPVTTPAAAASGAPATATGRASGRVPLQGAVNCRDLGGLRTWSGHRVRPGLIYRSDALNKPTAQDLAVLGSLGLRTVLDFRVALEVSSEGRDQLPPGLTATPHAITDNDLYAYTTGAIGTRDPAEQQRLLGDGKAAEFLTEVYRAFVTVPGNRDQFGAALRLIAGPAHSPLLFHCTSGKDRTGWLGYLLLRILGVPEHTAVHDYLASNVFRAEADAKTREDLRKAGLMADPELLVPLQEVRMDYLDAARAEVTRTYGSETAFLTEGLGLTRREIHRIRTRLLVHGRSPLPGRRP